MIYAVIDDNFQVWETFTSKTKAFGYLAIAHENLEKNNLSTHLVQVVEIPIPKEG